MNDESPVSTPTTHKKVGFAEFLMLVAAIMACQALAVDAMLPALPAIAQALSVVDENHAQWVVTAYMAGLGCGQLFCGMISDRVGRRPVLLTGLGLYVVAALLTGLSTSFTALLAWRFIHGVAAASAVVSRSVIRDLYDGRQMARVMSLTFIVFIMVPVVAPSLGQLVLWVAPWRYLFVLFSGFAAIIWLWVLLRLPETLHPEYRRALSVSGILQATKMVLSDRASVWYTLAMTMVFTTILAYVGMVQQIFAHVFHKPELMPAMFAICASGMGVMSFVNAKIVGRIGMRVVSQGGLLIFIAISCVHIAIILSGHESLVTFVLLQAVAMGCVGLMGANFGTMAMESMGPVAGIAASWQGFTSTVVAALVGALIGRQFNGSTLPLAVGALGCGLVALLCVLQAERWKLFQPHHAAE